MQAAVLVAPLEHAVDPDRPHARPRTRPGRLCSQEHDGVRGGGDHEDMWHVEVVCSDPRCDEELELRVEDLEEIDRAVCACECGVIVLTIASFEPLAVAAAA